MKSDTIEMFRSEVMFKREHASPSAYFMGNLLNAREIDLIVNLQTRDRTGTTLPIHT